MTGRRHRYAVALEWTGNRGAGTRDYRAYARDHTITAAGKPAIAGSADVAFRGDAARWNPEELLLASLAACHQLWFLHLAAEAGLTVVAYADCPDGEMVEADDGGGVFVAVTLRPAVTLAAQHDAAAATQVHALHTRAHALCFVARSVNFPVHCVPQPVSYAESSDT